MLKNTLSSPVRRVGIMLLLLSPLAYFLGVWLVLKYDASARTNLAIDRSQAIAIASGVAASRNINLTNWSSLCWIKANNDLHYYQQLPANPDRELARKTFPASVVAVLFRSPDRSENIEVEMAVDGRVIGFTQKSPKFGDAEDPGEPEARKIAEDALQHRLAAAGVPFSGELILEAPPTSPPPGGPGQMRPKGVNRKYIWKWPLSSIPEFKLESVFFVNGGTLAADRFEAKLDDDFIKAHHNPRKLLKILSIIAFCLVTAISVIFGIYRFVQRARQKEVSYQRVLVLVLGFATAMSSFVLVSDFVVAQVAGNPGFPVPDWGIQFSTAMFYLVIGLFVGMAYGGGEGDIREAFPGKLTSLDALLDGKIFSRNVARSVVPGLAIGGWVMLGFRLSTLPWTLIPGKGEPPEPLISAWLGYLPSFAAFAAWPTDVMVIIVIGLLVPLPFFLRRRKLGRTRMLFVFLFMWASCAAPYLDFRPWEGTLLAATVRAAMVLLAYLSFDLLTAIVAIAAPTFFSFAIGLAAQPAASIRQSGMISISAVVLLLLVELYFFFKGKMYSEEEVRPVYASLLAERLSMQAEVSAASLAQQRLMPATVPKSKYFSIAAKCLPAFEVGGDFYDVFELEPGKIGLLIAEGGGRGLGSALSIAFAKGFLMPKILGNTQTDDSPTEVIRSLQSRLATLLDEESAVGLAYVVIDAADGRLRYARTGAFPVVMAGKKHRPDSLVEIEETEIKFSVRGDSSKHVTVTEGSFNLNEGDSVILYTDGLAKNLQLAKKTPEAELSKVLKSSGQKHVDELQRALTDSIKKCSQRARKQGVEDDLTAVIVRVDQIESFAGSKF
ncbi:MAG TPA: SpoIIE family protein phosphatase [Blastocatellia bacterium]|nr:SpoIIE family protein phosphatase [Blastocatellia bacterium]